MANRTNEEIYEIISLLNQIMMYHKQWFHYLIRDMICQSTHNPQECSLQTGIIELDNLHQELHQCAETFLHAHKPNQSCNKDFDNLTNILDQFNTAIYIYQDELAMAMDIQSQPSMTANIVTILPILREQQGFAKRQGQACHISLIHIDLLNKIQDEYGAMIKEKILIFIAQFFIAQLRSHDRVFCYSHDAFLVSLQNVDATQALDLIDRLRITTSKTPINIGLSEPLYITVSCGVTSLDPVFTIEQSLEQANIALYLAKESGRNNTKSWSK